MEDVAVVELFGFLLIFILHFVCGYFPCTTGFRTAVSDRPTFMPWDSVMYRRIPALGIQV